ncbi:hypothetical protein FF38_13660 [Lucilia cuprina]|uniref:Uncharacterized protein n=1 Tax=Lucilia cuprina TaxID=7375 RepID=A0A0L0CR03_LUCCU|nr:hypothetical protein FF38_13660 [Lucilia cuprina]
MLTHFVVPNWSSPLFGTDSIFFYELQDRDRVGHTKFTRVAPTATTSNEFATVDDAVTAVAANNMKLRYAVATSSSSTDRVVVVLRAFTLVSVVLWYLKKLAPLEILIHMSTNYTSAICQRKQGREGEVLSKGYLTKYIYTYYIHARQDVEDEDVMQQK